MYGKSVLLPPARLFVERALQEIVRLRCSKGLKSVVSEGRIRARGLRGWRENIEGMDSVVDGGRWLKSVEEDREVKDAGGLAGRCMNIHDLTTNPYTTTELCLHYCISNSADGSQSLVGPMCRYEQRVFTFKYDFVYVCLWINIDTDTDVCKEMDIDMNLLKNSNQV